MKRWLKKLAGADRQKVIVVIASNREDAFAGIAHARTSGTSLPVCVWCAESGEAPAVCDRYEAGVSARRILKDLRQVWPALSILGWTGRGFEVSKLVAFLSPPFRVLIFNEAGGFFPATPGAVAGHLRRRSRDGLRSAAIRISEWTRSIAFRTGQRFRDVFVWIWNVLLAIAAVIAHATAPATFAVKRGIAGGTSSTLLVNRAESGEFTEIEMGARAWRRRRFLRVLNASQAPFLVIHRGHLDPEECRKLIELARSLNAFSVGRQEAFTGWRRQVLSKHPFRPLQCGEVTQVLAPHSPVLVMRRDMLLHLGVPAATTTGAALMSIYWKAAAAGLMSIVRGTGAAVPQEPAMPLEDAEFVLRLLMNRDLKKLAPADSDGSRGNVAFFPARTPSNPGHPRVLVVSPYLPYPLSHGGAVRMYNLCGALEEHVDFTLACFREAGDKVEYDALHRVFRSVYVIDIDEKQQDASVPEQVADYRNTAMAALIRRLCSERQVDLVQLEYTQMAEYREYTAGLPSILVEHDITFTLHQQISEAALSMVTRQQYELWLNFERDALREADVVWTMSEQDREIAVAHGASASEVAVIPNGVDLARFRPQPCRSDSSTVLFVGSFRHLPNLLAFEKLRDAIMPAVWQRCPNALLHVIAGPHHEKSAKLAGKGRLLASHPRISMQGYVEDVRDAYGNCDVVAVPLPISAGTNIKVMEAMACGRPVVSTTVGCHGLDLSDGEDVLIRDEPSSFANAVADLLTNHDSRRAIGERGRKTVEERFGWESIACRAFASYDSLLVKEGQSAAGD